MRSQYLLALILGTFIAIGIFISAPVVYTKMIDAGPAQPYSSIQAAIDKASPGDTVLVHGGIYKGLIIVNKQITLRGVSDIKGSPIIDGGGKGTPITLTADHASVEGFTIRNSGPNNYGVVVMSGGCTVLNNMIEGGNCGLKINAGKGNNIVGNTISGGASGIYLYNTKNNVINNNTIYGNKIGIRLYKSSSNTVTVNNILNNVIGLKIEDSGSNNNKIYLNDFVGNSGSQVIAAGANIWNSDIVQYKYGGSVFTGKLGNRYSDNTGSGSNKNGVSASPYLRGNIKDSSPLLASKKNYFLVGQVTPTIKPSANFVANITSGNAPLVVKFTDQSNSNGNPITSWQWNFGDGTSNVTMQNPTHTFTQPGIYKASLTVSNSNGTSTYRQRIIANLPNMTLITNGNRITYQNGTTFFIRGVGSDADSLTAVQADSLAKEFGNIGFNTLRNAIFWNQTWNDAGFRYINGYPDGTAMDSLDILITAFMRNGKYVTIDCHNYPPYGSTNIIDPVVIALNMRLFANWSILYGNCTNIMFEIWNEPGWYDWLQWQPAAQQITNLIRNNSSNLVLVGGTRMAYNISGPTLPGSKNITGGNIVYVQHIYSDSTSYSPFTWAGAAGNTPVTYPTIINEWGSYGGVSVDNEAVTHWYFHQLPYWVMNHSYAGIMSWCWNPGTGGQPMVINNVAPYTYNTEGWYYINLSKGNMPPFTKPVVNGTRATGVVLQFNDTYGWNVTNWKWSFGDGSANATGRNVTHAYATAGNYTVKLSATNPNYANVSKASRSYTYFRNTDPGYDNVSFYVNVTVTVTMTVVANFTTNITTGLTPLCVRFNDTSRGWPTTWQWNFGDGTSNVTMQNPTHTFTAVGYYNVMLTVKNANGSSTYTMRIEVKSPANLRLVTNGNRITFQNGTSIVLKGVNYNDVYLDMYDRAIPANYSVFSADFRQMKAWGANTVKLYIFAQFGSDGWGSVHPFWVNNRSEYLNALDTAITAANNAGLYVYLSYFDSGDPTDINEFERTKQAYAVLSQRYGSNPMVIFGTIPEPSMHIWPDMSWSRYKPYAQQLYNLIRKNTSNIITISGVDHGYDMHNIPGSPVSGVNIVYDEHVYPGNAKNLISYGMAMGTIAQKYPLIIGEWGGTPDAPVGSTPYAESYQAWSTPFLYYCQVQGVDGMFACGWDAHCADEMKMVNNTDDWHSPSKYYYYYPLTGWGNFVVSASWQNKIPPIASFTYSGKTTITFKDTSRNATSWKWNFGDRSPILISQNVKHTFKPGYYYVSLTVSNKWGSDTTIKKLQIK